MVNSKRNIRYLNKKTGLFEPIIPADYVLKKHYATSLDPLVLICHSQRSQPKGMKFKYTQVKSDVTCKICIANLSKQESTNAGV